MDHCTIFALIAGTYTPVLLCSIRPIDPFWAWVILAIEWGCTIIGIILNAIDIKKYSTLSMVLYLAMGWASAFRFNLLPEAVGMSGIYLLVAGGLAYTIGQRYSMVYKINIVICIVSGIYGYCLEVLYIFYV